MRFHHELNAELWKSQVNYSNYPASSLTIASSHLLQSESSNAPTSNKSNLQSISKYIYSTHLETDAFNLEQDVLF